MKINDESLYSINSEKNGREGSLYSEDKMKRNESLKYDIIAVRKDNI